MSSGAVAGEAMGPRPGLGEAMGPRPGLAIVSFPQGIVAICLRISIIVLALLAFITACVAVGTIRDIDSEFRDDVVDDSHADRTAKFFGVKTPDTPGIVIGSWAACGWIMFLCLMALLYQPLVIIVRCLNFGLVNRYLYVWIATDVALSILFALGFLPGAITEAAWADGWSEWQDYVEELEDVHGSDGADDIVDELDFYPGRIFGAMVSSATFSFLAILVFVFLVIWMILFLALKWNEKVIKYTNKKAAPNLSKC